MIINESIRPVIVIDVQPAYTRMVDWIPDLMDWLNSAQGPILMMVNAEDQGLTEDTILDCKLYWLTHGMTVETLDRVDVIDKGYGYLRAWMDDGVSEASIIRVIREMYRQRVNDTSMLWGGEDWKKHMDDLVKEPYPVDDHMSVEWLSIAQLKKYTGCLIMGGGRNECLKEVTLLMNAFNIKYTIVNKWVY